MNDNKMRWLVAAIIVLILLLIITCAPNLVSKVNTWEYNVQKVNEATSYHILKEVEDTCRAMIASYNADKNVYNQYKDSDNEEKQSWAEQAKMRANRTAANYNEYILKNSFVWRDNVPKDIAQSLPMID